MQHRPASLIASPSVVAERWQQPEKIKYQPKKYPLKSVDKIVGFKIK